NERGPYILVGHSLGGAYARMFAGKYRNEMAGLVLVDATNPSHMTTHAEAGLPPLDEDKAAPLLTSAFLPLAKTLRLRPVTYGSRWNELPADLVPAIKAFTSTDGYLPTYAKETASFSSTVGEIAALDSLGRLPVSVICSDRLANDADPETVAKRADWNK